MTLGPPASLVSTDPHKSLCSEFGFPKFRIWVTESQCILRVRAKVELSYKVLSDPSDQFIFLFLSFIVKMVNVFAVPGTFFCMFENQLI